MPKELIKEILPQGDYHLQEERRLFYVGLTRAIDKVFLSASQFYGDGKRVRKISPFIYETLGEKLIKNREMMKESQKAQLSIFDFRITEEKIVKNNLTINNFSFSQLENFRTCPLQYKYQYILRIPFAPTSAITFGDSVHRTLQKFYQEFLNNKNIDKKRLLTIFDEMWTPVGYASPTHEARMKKEGRLMLSTYFDKFHKVDLKVIGLEKLFKIKIASDIFVTGKIDRVDLLDNGEIEIIDYKTGKKPNDKELKKSLQLSIYALAAIDQGLYNKKLPQVNLCFYFLQDPCKVSMKRSAKEINDVKQEIIKTASEIRNHAFAPQVSALCDFCPYRIICEAWQ